MTKTLTGLEFDPGFAPYVLAFSGSVEYIYTDINRFKNLSQKKVKFMQYHKKILDIFYNNIGFYVGCLMWAVYLKSQPEQEILSNPCFGKAYSEEENISETPYMQKFVELFPKDMKYFLGKDFSFEDEIINLIKIYEDFLVLNKGFTKTKLNTDLILPDMVKTDDSSKFKSLIDNAINSKDLSLLKNDIKDIL